MCIKYIMVFLMLNNCTEKCDLSVIIIARNEEEMIADCIESVFTSIDNAHAAGIINSSEIILSDSASTDQTIEIAKKYPIKIIQLNKRWPLSASAGRYIGYLHSKGNFVLFMDGDCTLDKEWISISIPYFNKENVAGVDGIESEYIDIHSSFHNLFMSNEPKIEDVVEIDIVGKAIFKRNVLDEVGPYNPYLIGGEDRDISYRIRAAGYKLLLLPRLCVTHYWGKKEGKLTIRRYLMSVYVWSKGDGQALRHSFRNKKMATEHLLRYVNTFYIKIYGIILLFISLIYMNILTIYLAHMPIYLMLTVFVDAILLGLGAMYAGIRYKGGRWEEFLFSFHIIPYVFVRHIGFVIGFIESQKDPRKYPTDAKIIK